MFCVSDRLYPTPPHHCQLQQPATIFIPAIYDQQAVATMMMSVLPSGETLMTNFQPAPVPLLPRSSLTISEYQQESPPTPSRSTRDGLMLANFRATRRQQVRGTAASCGDDGVTSFRIADILDWRVGSSGRQAHRRVSRTALEKTKSSAVTKSIVRPWDERSSASSVSSTSNEVEERNVEDDDDDEAAQVDVDDSCSLPGTTSSDTTFDHDVCPLGALLRMTSQTNFDECANRLQECFNNGRYICSHLSSP